MSKISRWEENFWKKVKKTNTCWLWIGAKNSDGYGSFWVNGKSEKAHRASWIIHNKEIPNKLHVLHHCDNPSCVNPAHLYLGTHQDNMNDKKARKRSGYPSGEKCHLSKLTNEEVIKIRELSKLGISRKELSQKFGVSTENIREIIINKIWRHLI